MNNYNLLTTQTWDYETIVKCKPCTSPSHDFPSMLYVPPGETVVHTCPSCGQESKVVGQEFTLSYGI